MEQNGLVLERDALERQIKAGAGWFYFIAALSLINSLAMLFMESHTYFVMGLGVTRIFDRVALTYADLTDSTLIMEALAIDLLISGLFILFGILSSKKNKLGFFIGISLYVLDAIILIFLFDTPDIYSAAFHIVALIFLFKGFSSLQKYNEIENQLARTMHTYVQGYSVGDAASPGPANNFNPHNNANYNSPDVYTQNGYNNQNY